MNCVYQSIYLLETVSFSPSFDMLPPKINKNEMVYEKRKVWKGLCMATRAKAMEESNESGDRPAFSA